MRGDSGAVGALSALVRPLTRALFTNPTKTPDGQVYELAALADVLARGGCDPLTGSAIALADCVPDDDVKAKADALRARIAGDA